MVLEWLEEKLSDHRLSFIFFSASPTSRTKTTAFSDYMNKMNTHYHI